MKVKQTQEKNGGETKKKKKQSCWDIFMRQGRVGETAVYSPSV